MRGRIVGHFWEVRTSAAPAGRGEAQRENVSTVYIVAAGRDNRELAAAGPNSRGVTFSSRDRGAAAETAAIRP
jgi:hypothetical protein